MFLGASSISILRRVKRSLNLILKQTTTNWTYRPPLSSVWARDILDISSSRMASPTSSRSTWSLSRNLASAVANLRIASKLRADVNVMSCIHVVFLTYFMKPHSSSLYFNFTAIHSDSHYLVLKIVKRMIFKFGMEIPLMLFMCKQKILQCSTTKCFKA